MTDQMTHALDAFYILEAKDPQLAFLLRLEAAKADHLDALACEEDTELEKAFLVNKVKEEQPTIVYALGLGTGHHFIALQRWLESESKRKLIVIEEKIEAILAFIQMPCAAAFFKHSQVKLQYVMDRKLFGAIEACVKEEPVEKVFVYTLPAYKAKWTKRYKQAEYRLYRSASIHSSLLKDDLYQHALFRNYYLNYKRLPEAFVADDLRGAFQNVPCIICGAGPSLNEAAPLLKQLEHQALIIAGGSSITALGHYGITPHLGFAIDPNEEEYKRFKPSKALHMPLIFGTRVHPDIFQTRSGPLGYLRTHTGGLLEVLLDEKLKLEGELFQTGMSQDGMSVTILCLASAVAMGCSPIIFVGVDLAYTGGHHYAKGVVEDSRASSKMLSSTKASDRLLRRKNERGKFVTTCMRWVMEKTALDGFMKKHPSITFIDAVEGGLGFAAAKQQTLQEITSSHLVSQDIKALVYQSIHKCRSLKNEEKEISSFIQQLQESLHHCKKLLEELISRLKGHTSPSSYQDDPLVMLATMDLEEQLIYQKVGRIQLEAFDKSHPVTCVTIQSLHARWVFLSEIFDSYLNIIESV